MAALQVGHGHGVEEEGLHVVIKGFVVQKQHGQEAQVLAVGLVQSAVNLPHR